MNWTLKEVEKAWTNNAGEKDVHRRPNRSL